MSKRIPIIHFGTPCYSGPTNSRIMACDVDKKQLVTPGRKHSLRWRDVTCEKCFNRRPEKNGGKP